MPTGNTSIITYPCATCRHKYSDIPGLVTRAATLSVTKEFRFPTINRVAAAKKQTTITDLFTKRLRLLNPYGHGRKKGTVKLNPKQEIKVKILLLFNKLTRQYTNRCTPIKFCNENRTLLWWNCELFLQYLQKIISSSKVNDFIFYLLFYQSLSVNSITFQVDTLWFYSTSRT